MEESGASDTHRPLFFRTGGRRLLQSGLDDYFTAIANATVDIEMEIAIAFDANRDFCAVIVIAARTFMAGDPDVAVDEAGLWRAPYFGTLDYMCAIA